MGGGWTKNPLGHISEKVTFYQMGVSSLQTLIQRVVCETPHGHGA